MRALPLKTIRSLPIACLFLGFVFPAQRSFALPLILLSGKVTDYAMGQPIAGASVTLSAGSTVTVTTDSNGNYSINGAQWTPRGTAEMWIVAPGYFTPVLSVDINAPFPVTVNEGLLRGNTVLQGKITDAGTGLPIAGANLTYSSAALSPGSSTRNIQTDSSGSYAIDASQFTEAGSAGTQVALTVSVAGYVQGIAAFQTSPPYPNTENFALAVTPSVILQGTVTDKASTQPIAGAAVTLSWSTGTPATLTLYTDANGKYSVSGQQWNADAAQVWIVVPGYFTPSVSANISPPYPATLNRALIKGGTVIQGAVTDASTNLPIAGANVNYSSTLFAPNGGSTRSVQTDTTGNYQIDSSQYLESAATSKFTTTLQVSSAPGYVQNSSTVSAQAPFPVTKNVKLTATGTTESVTITTNPASMSIVVDGTSYTAPHTFTWVPGNPHTIGVTSPQACPGVSQAGTRCIFASWSDSGAQSHQIVPTGTATYTAAFTTQYLLQTNVVPPGAATIGANPESADGYYSSGAQVQLTVTPAGGYQFAGWTGSLTGMALTPTVTMNAPETATANFGMNRTFVSGSGSDNVSCSISTPCRTLTAALASTIAGGEIVILTSGDYDPITITQPVTISGQSVVAAITAASGNAIVVNTPGNVTITGLGLHGLGTGNDGILVEQVGILRLYRVTAEGFLNDGVEFQGAGNLSVDGSRFTDNQNGVAILNASAYAYVHGSSFDGNVQAGLSTVRGAAVLASSAAHYNGTGAEAARGALVLTRVSTMFNQSGISAMSGSSAQYSYCSVTQNLQAYTIAAGAAMSGSTPGTSLISGSTAGTPAAASPLQ